MSLFKNKIIFLIFVNVIFLLSYSFLLKKYLIDIVNRNPDIIDKTYYSAIFSNLEISSVITIILLILCLVFKLQFDAFTKVITSNGRFVWLFIIINIILQVVIIFSIKTIQISDSIYYISHATRLFETGSYINEFGNKTAFWPVGLPIMIFLVFYIFGKSIVILQFINIIFNSALIFVLYKIFQNYLSNRQMVVFLSFYTFNPNNLFNVNPIMTELPFVFFLWLSVLIYQRKRKYHLALIGILCTLMVYFRPVGLFLPLIFFIDMWNNHSFYVSVKKILLIFSVMIILLSPWIFRNYLVFDALVIGSTNGGYNFLMGNHKGASGGINFDFNYNIKNPNEAEESKIAFHKGVISILEHPFEAIERIPKKIFYSYIRGDNSITWSLKKTENYIPVIMLSMIFYLTNLIFYSIVFFSLLSLIILRKDISKERIFVTIAIYFLLIIIFFVGNERYLLPIMPIHIYYATKLFFKGNDTNIILEK